MEAFVYKWKNIETGLEYIGYHKGDTDDGYVSSSQNNHFWKDYNNGLLKREILFYGSVLECVEYESNLLKNKNIDNLYNRNINGKIIWTNDLKEKTRKSHLGYKQSKQHIENRKKSLKGRKPGFKGKSHTQETVNKMKLVERTDEHKEAISKALKGRTSPTKGIPHNKIKCVHCGRDIAKNVYSRWHGDNCKEK